MNEIFGDCIYLVLAPQGILIIGSLNSLPKPKSRSWFLMHHLGEYQRNMLRYSMLPIKLPLISRNGHNLHKLQFLSQILCSWSMLSVRLKRYEKLVCKVLNKIHYFLSIQNICKGLRIDVLHYKMECLLNLYKNRHQFSQARKYNCNSNKFHSMKNIFHMVLWHYTR